MNIPKLIITDVDGVLTDGGMYYDNKDNEWKKFNTSDSWGVAFCKALKIPVAIITGENTNIVKRRGEKLKLEEVLMGVQDKLKAADGLREKYKLDWKDIAFIGDDINDLKLLQKVGYSACTQNAPAYIKDKVKTVTKKNGGDGAFREYVELLLTKKYNIGELIEMVTKNK